MTLVYPPVLLRLAMILLLGGFHLSSSYAQSAVADLVGPDQARRRINFNTSSGSVEMDANELFLLLAQKTRIDYVVNKNSLSGKITLPKSSMTTEEVFEKLLSEQRLHIYKDASGTALLLPKSVVRRPGTALQQDVQKVLETAMLGVVSVATPDAPAGELVSLLMTRMKLAKPTGETGERLAISVKNKPTDVVLKSVLEAAQLRLEPAGKGSALKPAK